MSEKEPNWEEVTPAFNETWNFNEKPEFVGEFMGKKEKVGRNESMLYTFLKDGEPVDVWGSTVLDPRLKDVTEGQLVKIVFNGVKDGEGGRKYKDFAVFKSNNA